MDNQINQNEPIIQEGTYESETKKEARKEKWKRIGIGLLIIFLVASLGGEDGLTILGLTIVCTAGISLVIYLPLAWLFGTLVITVYRFLFRKYIKKFEDKEEIKINNNQKAITDYILQARSFGLDDGIIKHRLMTDGGWSKEEVEKSFSKIIK